MPVHSVAELIALAKAKPGTLDLRFARHRHAAAPGWRAVQARRRHRCDTCAVQGRRQRCADLIGGQITWSIDGPTVQLPHVKAGRLRALAVTSATRSRRRCRTCRRIAEAGVPGYEYIGWTGIAAPAATPKPIVAQAVRGDREADGERRSARVVRVDRRRAGGDAPEEFAAFIRAEHAKWGRVVREAGIKPE